MNPEELPAITEMPQREHRRKRRKKRLARVYICPECRTRLVGPQTYLHYDHGRKSRHCPHCNALVYRAMPKSRDKHKTKYLGRQ